jgi:undecaprenyl-diphosphatase
MERLEAYDLGMLYWFTAWRSPWLNETLLMLTRLGDFVIVASLVLLAAGCFLVARRIRFAGVIALIGLLAWGIDYGVKLAVDRPRPNISTALADPPALPSFPSGHALGTMAVYGTLGLLLGRIVPRLAYLFVITGIGISLVVGLTRVMIGVHYPFDVLAGWLAGLMLLVLARALIGPPPEKTPS